MSATGAITGNGVYSEIEYQGHRFKVAQWYVDAMDAVSTAAFLKSARMTAMMGGTPKAVAAREVELARTFSLGGFAFDAILDEGGLDNDQELLATFLHQLLLPHDATVSHGLALEMVKANRDGVIAAVNRANPRNGQQAEKTGLTVQQDQPATVAASTVPLPTAV